MNPDTTAIDVLIVGGGVLGLFTLDRCVARGASALLVESCALGNGQTCASQGIIHAGTKYALGGEIGDDAHAVATAAQEWGSMFERPDGNLPDLRDSKILTDHCHLWRTSSLMGAAGMVAARLALRSRPLALAKEQRPLWLADVNGDVLALPELVVDPMSVLEVLADRHRSRLALGEVRRITQELDGVTVEIATPAPITIHARRVVLAGGSGNEALALLAGVDAPMQRRPLRQAMLRGPLPMAFGHCIDGAKTRMTVTSDSDPSGATVWHIGGQLAETGVRMGEVEFQEHAISEVRHCIPGITLSGCEFASYLVDRAEPATAGGKRPSHAHADSVGSITVAWPVKLVLAPVLAGEIANSLETSGDSQRSWPRGLPAPHLARRPWDLAEWSRI